MRQNVVLKSVVVLLVVGAMYVVFYKMGGGFGFGMLPTVETDIPEDDARFAEPGSFFDVRVYYATDRKPREVTDLRYGELAEGFYWTITGLVVGLASIALMIVLGFKLGSWKLKGAAVLVGLTILLGAPVLADQIEIWRHRHAKGVWYGSQHGELAYGYCDVTVPKSQGMEELGEVPFVYSLFFQPDPEKHVIVKEVEAKSQEVFFSEFQQSINSTASKEAFVLVHGYDTDFEYAARRAAQLARDLKFGVVPIVFSWPSENKVLRYSADENNVDLAIPDLLAFLKALAKQTDTRRVHLIAHSMGNRILAEVLRRIAFESAIKDAMYKEVVLAAPDVDARVFAKDKAEGIFLVSSRVTIYIADGDGPLTWSGWLHNAARLGSSFADVLANPKLHSIDVNAVVKDKLKHSYIYANANVRNDLFYLIREGKAPNGRAGIEPVYSQDKIRWWAFRKP